MHDFHKQFNVLLDLLALIKLKININFVNNHVQLCNKQFRYNYFNTVDNVNLQNVVEIKIRSDHPKKEKKLHSKLLTNMNKFFQQTIKFCLLVQQNMKLKRQTKFAFPTVIKMKRMTK